MSINFKKEHKNFLNDSVLAQKVYDAVEKEVSTDYAHATASYLMESMIKHNLNTVSFSSEPFAYFDNSNSKEVSLLYKFYNKQPLHVKYSLSATSLVISRPEFKNLPKKLREEFAQTYSPAMTVNFQKEHKDFLANSSAASEIYKLVEERMGAEEKKVYKNFIFDIATYVMECVIKNQLSNTRVFNQDSFSFLDKTNSSRAQALRKNLNERSGDEVLPRSIKHIVFSRGINMTSLALLTPVDSSKNAPLLMDELKTEFKATYAPEKKPKKKI